MNEKTRVVKTADNETVMPSGVFGHVDEVNGEGAAEVSGFVPSRHELIQLAEYWERIALKEEWWWFLTGQTGGDISRLITFARRRIDRIWNLLGKEEVKPAIDRVYAEFEKENDPRLWDIFLHGDDAQWEAVQKETLGLPEEEESTRAAGQIMSGHSDSKDPHSGGE